MYQLGVLSFIPFLLSWPALSYFCHRSPLLLYVMLLLYLAMKQIAGSTAFTASMVMVNMSVPAVALGAVNGLGQSFAAGGRAVM